MKKLLVAIYFLTLSVSFVSAAPESCCSFPVNNVAGRFALGYNNDIKSLVVRHWFSKSWGKELSKWGAELSFALKGGSLILNDKFFVDLLGEIFKKDIPYIKLSAKGNFWYTKLNFFRVIKEFEKAKIYCNVFFGLGHLYLDAKFDSKGTSGSDEASWNTDIEEYIYGIGCGVGVEYFVFKNLSFVGDFGFKYHYLGRVGSEVNGSYFGMYDNGWWPNVGIRFYF
ncbi:MAG: hypothetical protein LBT18_02035 [Endomicrobium sp.]|jgi:hypothetical protein|nr:hypothetical protein [Endomicrobium sp.]